MFILPIMIYSSNLRNLESSIVLDKDNWSYDSTNGVYYQIGVTYCKNPASSTHNILGIYVPGNYMSCSSSSSSSSKYSCSINTSGQVGSYTASTAPIVMPINTAGYSAQNGPTSYSYNGLSDYLSAGFIYVYAGCRGRHEGESYNSGAPWGVTDLKAAIRFIRYNANRIPGDMNSFFSFGHSGGGAQSCLLGITGDSSLFNDYLNNIGAAMSYDNGTTISDAIKGSQCWCPITNLDTADMAYEWNLGQYSTEGTRSSGTFTKQLSDDLSLNYIDYINRLKLKDENGNILSLSTTQVNSGSYYDYIKSIIQTSLNNFLSDTTFPYTQSSNERPDGGFPGGNSPPEGEPQSGNEPPSGTRILATSYDTVLDYIQYLNSDETWVNYDSTSNTATINSIGSFVKKCKNPTKDVGAFDSFSKSQAENKLFGISSTTSTAHFDTYMSQLLNEKDSTYNSLSNYDSEYKTSYKNEIENLKDALGNSIEHRANMYNPMYYICDIYSGYRSSQVASYFRINTGITQGDTSNCVEINLALALQNFGKNVEFTTVWEQGHTTAEREGSGQSTSNFINWVDDCMIDSKITENGGKRKSGHLYYKINIKYIISLLFLLL